MRWDSDPRWRFHHNGFQDRPFRPLRHPSADGKGIEPSVPFRGHPLSRRTGRTNRPNHPYPPAGIEPALFPDFKSGASADCATGA